MSTSGHPNVGYTCEEVWIALTDVSDTAARMEKRKEKPLAPPSHTDLSSYVLLLAPSLIIKLAFSRHLAWLRASGSPGTLQALWGRSRLGNNGVLGLSDVSQPLLDHSVC